MESYPLPQILGPSNARPFLPRVTSHYTGLNIQECTELQISQISLGPFLNIFSHI